MTDSKRQKKILDELKREKEPTFDFDKVWLGVIFIWLLSVIALLSVILNLIFQGKFDEFVSLVVGFVI